MLYPVQDTLPLHKDAIHDQDRDDPDALTRPQALASADHHEMAGNPHQLGRLSDRFETETSVCLTDDRGRHGTKGASPGQSRTALGGKHRLQHPD